MITLNEVTQKMSSEDFDTYRLADLIDSLESDISAEDQEGLKERLAHIESIRFDLEFDAPELDEMYILRSMFPQD